LGAGAHVIPLYYPNPGPGNTALSQSGHCSGKAKLIERLYFPVLDRCTFFVLHFGQDFPLSFPSYGLLGFWGWNNTLPKKCKTGFPAVLLLEYIFLERLIIFINNLLNGV
jgi:hypothetical protein